MNETPDILCIGAVLWDIIGRSASHMRAGSDVPGRITRLPGGVAMNIAMAAGRFGMRPALLTAVGRDAEGEELIAACRALGMETGFAYRSEDLPTDRYMAVEGANGLIAAIADAHSLEAAGARILAPLRDGRLGSTARPWTGRIALDGNLTVALLREIAGDACFAAADLRIAPASPGKAERLHVFLGHPRAVFYVNLEEAGLLCQTEFADSATAAEALHARGAARAVVTDGGRMASDAGPHGLVSRTPPEVLVTRVTGAGDTFMAAHMAAETRGMAPGDAMERALQAAATYVSGDNAL
ncbi:kinase [Oceanicola sp. 22II-s10i]|uniref:PfkB family carbohydrate kinase n=1 Tax=Oceanicola sp. 22II-s10i TaxID=1317116 RepID=UPI000B51F5FA|nr:PfkB family carbohydrate kinase [Oceanicola sp. 22II-s10i]OWU84941.1 kinase [Oceanicola sp. 22II-s10i]